MSLRERNGCNQINELISEAIGDEMQDRNHSSELLTGVKSVVLWLGQRSEYEVGI